MADLWEFLAAAGYIGGGSVIFALVLFALAVIEHFREKNVAGWWLVVAATVAFGFGAFRAWQDEHGARLAADQKYSSLAEEQQPRFNGTIELFSGGGAPVGLRHATEDTPLYSS